MAITQRTCSTDRMNVYRLAARYLVAFGGLFWTAVVFAGAMKMNSSSIFGFVPTTPKFTTALAYSLVWILVALGVFVLGLFFERIAAILLIIAAVASIAFGAQQGWESGEWIIMVVFIIGPVLTAAVFYLLAAREQALCDDGGASSGGKPSVEATS